jgi:2-desacetyl-2-hydroxyethyl bacteriochlorophyllide A dehydrogenase
VNARRLWITGRHEVDLAPFEVSEALAPDQVLIETERTLVSAGTELAIVMGTHIGFTTGARWPRYPMALGYTAVGRVAAVGDAVDRFRVGDRVLAETPHATHAVAAAGTLLPVPEGCPPDAALLAHLASIPLTGVRLARPQIGEGVVVLGQGLIGALAARLARLSGCRPVLGVDLLPARRRIAEAAGIVPVDPREDDPAAVYRGLAAGRDPEIVIEATGAPEVIADALRMAAEMGRVVLLGSPRGRVEIDPYTHVHGKGVSVIGAHHRVTPKVPTPLTPFTAERNRETVLTLVADGSLSMAGLVSHHVRPEEAAQTYRALADRSPEFMGVVIDWGGVQ